MKNKQGAVPQEEPYVHVPRHPDAEDVLKSLKARGTIKGYWIRHVRVASVELPVSRMDASTVKLRKLGQQFLTDGRDRERAEVQVRYQPKGGATAVVIVANDGEELCGIARCHPDAWFVRRSGRLVALDNLIDGLHAEKPEWFNDVQS